MISPGIIITPLAKDELTGPRGEGYRRMIQVSAAGRPGTPDEVGTVGALLMGPDGGFITGSDILMDGGVTAPTGTANSLLNEARALIGAIASFGPKEGSIPRTLAAVWLSPEASMMAFTRSRVRSPSAPPTPATT